MATQYRVLTEDQMALQRPVIAILNDPAGGEAKGDRYLVGDTGVNGFNGHDNEIARCTGTGPVTWAFDTPLEGWEVYDADTGKYYQYDGAAWAERPGGSVAAPLTLTVDDANRTTPTTILTLAHTTTSGSFGGLGMASQLDFALEDNAGHAAEVAGSVRAEWTDPASGAEKSLVVLSAMRDGSMVDGLKVGRTGRYMNAGAIIVGEPSVGCELVFATSPNEDFLLLHDGNFQLYGNNCGTMIYCNQADAFVGILTDSPTYPLDVTGDINTTTHYRIDSTPGSDHTGTGILSEWTAGETVAAGQVVYIKSDGKVWLADADAATTMPAIGIVETGGNATDTVTVLTHGFFRDDSWEWTVGGLVYVDTTTAGGLTQTAPSGTGDQVQAFGVATATDRILVNPSLVLVEVA